LTEVPFPQTFVINLDDRVDRWTLIEQACRAAGIRATRIAGVPATPGWRGCALSHLRCIRMAKENNLPWVLILEDDATFTPEAIERFRGLLPYLWEHREQWERFNGGPTFPPDPELKLWSRNPPLVYANGLATHFNLIHRGAYDTILQYDHEQDHEIDLFYMALEHRFRTVFNNVATWPHISVQRQDSSNITPDVSEGDYASYFWFSEQALGACLRAAEEQSIEGRLKIFANGIEARGPRVLIPARKKVTTLGMECELPPIYLLNLDRSVERLRLFKERNAHLTEVTRIPAVDGSTLDREDLVRSGYISADFSYKAGALGCALSHIGLWATAIAQNRPITIFEDGIAVSAQFEKCAAEMLENLPDDWDFLLWGYHLNPLFVWADAGTSKVMLTGYGSPPYQGTDGIQQFQMEKFQRVTLRMRHAFGTFGYSISPHGARAALEYCLPLRNRMIEFPDAGVVTDDEGIDVALCGLYPLVKAYISVPPLVIRCDDVASVREEINNQVSSDAEQSSAPRELDRNDP